MPVSPRSPDLSARRYWTTRKSIPSLRKLLQKVDDGLGAVQDVDLIGDLAKNIMGRTFCPLGDAAAMPTISIVEKFRHEFEAKLMAMPAEPAVRELVSIQ